MEELFSLDGLFTVQSLIALVTLATLEIVLGIDNIVFISILTGRLPEAERPRARRLGLLVALVARLVLLGSIFLIMRLDTPLFHLPENPLLYEHDPANPEAHAPLGVSVKDLILLLGGLFLIGKATVEIHHKMEGGESPAGETPDPIRVKAGPTFRSVITQIMLIDIVFSLDSVITAVGMVNNFWIMASAVVIAIMVMLLFVNPISNFVERHPTVKMLALAFLILIGFMLVAESVDRHIERGYIYFAMAFSLAVEMLNLRARRALERGRAGKLA